MIDSWGKRICLCVVCASLFFTLIGWNSRVLSRSSAIHEESAQLVELSEEHGSRIKDESKGGSGSDTPITAGTLSRFGMLLDEHGASSRSMSSEQHDTELVISSSFLIRFHSLHDLLESIYVHETLWRVTQVSARSERSEQTQNDGLVRVDLVFHEFTLDDHRELGQ